MSATGDHALVIGEALIDIVEQNGVSREHIGGSPANVAIGLARLGHSVRILTRLGRDARGDRIGEHLALEGVSVDPASFASRETATARAVIASDGSAQYHFDIDWAVPEGSQHDSSAHQPTLVHIGSIALFLEPGGSEVLRIAQQQATDTVVTLDPNIRPSLLPEHQAALARFEAAAMAADAIKLSDEDAEWLYPGEGFHAISDRLLSLSGVRDRPGPSVVVITRGGDGAYARSDTGGLDVPARAVQVVDTISAGDSFMASLASSLLERGLSGTVAELRDVVERANAAASHAVSLPGANPPYRADLARLAGL